MKNKYTEHGKVPFTPKLMHIYIAQRLAKKKKKNTGKGSVTHTGANVVKRRSDNSWSVSLLVFSAGGNVAAAAIVIAIVAITWTVPAVKRPSVQQHNIEKLT